MSLIVDTTAAFFRIREHTKDEFVAVGSNGNILRWGETGGPDQDWLLLPMGDRSYRIMTRTNGEYMAVGTGGNILRWGYADNQIFRLVNEDPAGTTMNIQEPSKDEFVAVGSNGNVLRWGKTGGKDQLFTLEPHDPAAKPALPSVEAQPGSIGDIPRLTSADPSSLPMRSEAKIVAATHVPATLVSDPGYSDKIVQMESNPYYIAVRRQFWSREENHGYTYEHVQGEQNTFEKEITYQVTNRSSRTSEETWGWKFSINSEMSASAEVEGIGVTATRGMAFEISQQFRTELVEESVIVQKSTEKVTRRYDSAQPNFVIAGWILVDSYTLYKGDGKTVISEVEAGSKSSLRKDAFPKNTPEPETR